MLVFSLYVIPHYLAERKIAPTTQYSIIISNCDIFVVEMIDAKQSVAPTMKASMLNSRS